MKIITVLVLLVLLIPLSANADKVPIKFNCEENGTVCWTIPNWARQNKDYVGTRSGVSSDMSIEGKKSLKVMCDFPGNRWSAVMVECQRNIDLTGYRTISAEVYLPESAPSGFIRARFIITAGNWLFIETKNAKKLRRGKWTKITAKIGGKRFRDTRYWKCKDNESCIIANIDDIKVLGIRIEYNANASYAGPPYKGPIYIDDIVIS